MTNSITSSSIVHLHFSLQNHLFLHYSHSNANQHVVLDFWDLCGQPTRKPPTPPYYIALIHYTLVNDSWLWVISYDSSLHSRSRNSGISLSTKSRHVFHFNMTLHGPLLQMRHLLILHKPQMIYLYLCYRQSNFSLVNPKTNRNTWNKKNLKLRTSIYIQ